jgi:hypothetical protein
VRPAGDLGDARRAGKRQRRRGGGTGDLIELAEAGVAIRMQPAGKAGELGATVLALAVRRVAIEHGRRSSAAVRALIAQVDPLPAGLGPTRAGSQHRHRRVVGVDHAAGHHVASNQLTERLEQPRDVAEPFGELAAIDIDAAAGIDLGLPVERQASRAEGFHLRALPEPYVSLSAHTAPSIRPF